jgi:transcriptional regulator with XRE-family HTH domain
MSESIIARIKEAIAHAGVSQRELAKRIDTTPAAVSRWLSGEREFPEDRIPAFAKALGVSRESLIGSQPSESEPRVLDSRLDWHFRAAPKDGGQDGGNANVYATPAGIDTLARETGQNSGDQREDGSHLRIQVALIELKKGGDAYERFTSGLRLDELRNHMEASADTDFRSSQKVRAALDRLAASDRLFLLRFSDFGATGLFGDEKSRPGVHATFPSLVRDNLNSSKSGETAGGSYGLGKATLWRASGLNTVLFS